MGTMGITELSEDLIQKLLSETRERGGYKTVGVEFVKSDMLGIDVTERFKSAKPASVYQGFRSWVKESKVEGIMVKQHNERVYLIKSASQEVEEEQEQAA